MVKDNPGDRESLWIIVKEEDMDLGIENKRMDYAYPKVRNLLLESGRISNLLDKRIRIEELSLMKFDEIEKEEDETSVSQDDDLFSKLTVYKTVDVVLLLRWRECPNTALLIFYVHFTCILYVLFSYTT